VRFEEDENRSGVLVDGLTMAPKVRLPPLHPEHITPLTLLAAQHPSSSDSSSLDSKCSSSFQFRRTLLSLPLLRRSAVPYIVIEPFYSCSNAFEAHSEGK
jgi:hypothetical protein